MMISEEDAIKLFNEGTVTSSADGQLYKIIEKKAYATYYDLICTVDGVNKFLIPVVQDEDKIYAYVEETTCYKDA